MLKRLNKTVHTKLKLDNGYLWILLRHNEPCSNRWNKQINIDCWIYPSNKDFDNSRVHKLSFNNYLNFKRFKDSFR